MPETDVGEMLFAAGVVGMRSYATINNMRPSVLQLLQMHPLLTYPHNEDRCKNKAASLPRCAFRIHSVLS